MFFLKCADVFLGGRWAGIFIDNVAVYFLLLLCSNDYFTYDTDKCIFYIKIENTSRVDCLKRIFCR